MTNSWPRFLAALLLFASAALYLRAHSRNEVFPAHLPLQSLPVQIGAWSGTDEIIDQETRDVLGPGEFLSRDYTPTAQEGSSIELFIAYFPSQSAGDTIHSPMHCLPGSGWLPTDSSRVMVTVPGHGPFPANRVVMARGERRNLVLYWFWAHDRGVASEYWAKYYLVKDSIKMHRSDGALVRVITPLLSGESVDSAYQRVLPFAGEIVPLLDDFIPR
jgi:EpsI family protein